MPEKDEAAKRRRARGRPLTSDNAAATARRRWAPDARTREAVRLLIAEKPPLTEEQRDALRRLLAE